MRGDGWFVYSRVRPEVGREPGDLFGGVGEGGGKGRDALLRLVGVTLSR